MNNILGSNLSTPWMKFLRKMRPIRRNFYFSAFGAFSVDIGTFPRGPISHLLVYGERWRTHNRTMWGSTNFTYFTTTAFQFWKCPEDFPLNDTKRPQLPQDYITPYPQLQKSMYRYLTYVHITGWGHNIITIKNILLFQRWSYTCTRVL